ncbi:DUF4260 family protein [Paracoccus sp. M683]|uniref:DUF4260 domain-containing protein n=1 Tax=Paracoccus sp. M683 TaxID=2594268 RepID=UPI00117F45C6|nr:DUF4260 domain-containing protein [Paracoccus sp. M683]TRW97321.1 DUF4260 family protein [Paracoccus sp. M683]
MIAPVIAPVIAGGWQRAEGLLVALAGFAIAIAVQPGWPWWAWPLLLLTPDLSMLGYLAGPRVGAVTYNAAHLYGAGLVLAVLGVITGQTLLIALGGLWLAHVGADRAIGYGLKSPDGFRLTHLGRIGRNGG